MNRNFLRIKNLKIFFIIQPKEKDTCFWILSSWHIKKQLNNSNYRRIEFTEKVHNLKIAPIITVNSNKYANIVASMLVHISEFKANLLHSIVPLYSSFLILPRNKNHQLYF